MTDNEIIEALKGCFNGILSDYCLNCPLYDDDSCQYVLKKKAIDLINRQKAEIERLKQENKEYCEANRIIAYQRNQRDKEIRALHNQLNGLNFMDKQIKSEAIKEFAERLKERYESVDGQYIDRVLNSDIDTLIKEMTEVQDND